MKKDWTGRAALSALLIIILGSLVGPLLMHSSAQIDLSQGLVPPSWLARHPLGTDLLGRDQLSRIFQGGRISLLVAVMGTGVACLIGVPYGAVSGWFGGRIDGFMMRLVDALYALPFMFLAMLVIALFGSGPVSLLQRTVLLFCLLGAVSWLTLARIVRAKVLSLKDQPFVEAARAQGAGHMRILGKHVVPNAAGIILTYATLIVPTVILQEAFLSFLGLGIQPPMASWGTLLNDGVQAMSVAPWLMVGPATLLIVTLLSLNILGDHLQNHWARRA